MEWSQDRFHRLSFSPGVQPLAKSRIIRATGALYLLNHTLTQCKRDGHIFIWRRPVFGFIGSYKLLIGEGLAGPRAEGLVENYTGWSKAQCLMNHGLTHSYHHVGEMNVISSLMGLGS